MPVSNTSMSNPIAPDAAEITRLKARIDTTVLLRGKSPAHYAAWSEACAEFHRRYNMLAFPGGYVEALVKFAAGDPSPIEATLSFLEQRPYFFRSGYMFKTLMRRVKRAELKQGQRKRLDAVLVRQAAWRARKQRPDQV
jgi:hypothetical protein